jgi:predicted ABC-type ATPase
LLLTRIKELTKAKQDFGFETTLAGRGYLRLFKKLRINGYRVVLFFLWLPSADMAVARVRARVQQGGHNVPEPVIRRRYKSGLKNSFLLYRPCAHVWRLYDASHLPPEIVAHEEMGKTELHDATVFENITHDIRK